MCNSPITVHTLYIDGCNLACELQKLRYVFTYVNLFLVRQSIYLRIKTSSHQCKEIISNHWAIAWHLSGVVARTVNIKFQMRQWTWAVNQVKYSVMCLAKKYCKYLREFFISRMFDVNLIHRYSYTSLNCMSYI